MYMLTYVGAMVNGLTLLTLAWVGMFALPRLYKDNQKQIDDAILPLKTKLEELQVKAFLPLSLSFFCVFFSSLSFFLFLLFFSLSLSFSHTHTHILRYSDLVALIINLCTKYESVV